MRLAKLNKKGYVFVGLVVIFSFFVLLSAFLVLNDKYQVRNVAGIERSIGEQQAELFKTYQEGEKVKFYLSRAAKLSAENAIALLARNESGCGSYLGFSIWSNKTVECYPEKIIEKFSLLQANEINKLSRYSGALIPKDNYDYSVEDNDQILSVKGAAKENVLLGGKLEFENVRVTQYYAASEEDFSAWSTGVDYKKFSGWEIGSWCVIPLSQRGFYEEVQCEGSGVSKTGEAYGYSDENRKSIQPTPEASIPVGGIYTATGTEATPHRTIAVAPDMIPYGSRVQINFEGCKNQECCDAWNGEYVAEDTGIAMRRDWERGIAHIDLYAGYGKKALEDASCLPQKANLKVISAGDVNSTLFYKIKPNFKFDISYSFDEYELLTQAIKAISEEITQKKECFNAGVNTEDCISSEVISKHSEFKFEFSCGAEEEKAVYGLLQTMLSCSESGQEGACRYDIPSVSVPIEINFRNNPYSKNTKVYSKSINESLNQLYPSILLKFSGSNPVQTTCEEVQIKISKDRKAELAAKNCANQEDAKLQFENEISIFNVLSPLEKVSTLAFMDSKLNANEISAVKKHFRLCAESKFKFFNESGGLEPLKYKIAFFAGDTVSPKPVQNIAVIDTPKAEQSITLSFDANEELDTSHYNIYYSTADFEKAELSDKILKLGSIESTGATLYTQALLLPNDGLFYFAVTAVDTSGNEDKTVEAVQGISIDDLKPGPIEKVEFERTTELRPTVTLFITPPASDLFSGDLTGYDVFLRETLSSSCNYQDIPSTLSGKKYEGLFFDMSLPIHTTKIELPDAAKKYCVAVIANDENPQRENILPEQYSEKSIVFVSINQ